MSIHGRIPSAEIPDDRYVPDWIRAAARRGARQQRYYPKRTEKLLATWCNAGPSLDVPHLMDAADAAEYQKDLTPVQRLVLRQACSTFMNGKVPTPFLRERRRTSLGQLRVSMWFAAVVKQVATCARVALATKASADDAAPVAKAPAVNLTVENRVQLGVVAIIQKAKSTPTASTESPAPAAAKQRAKTASAGRKRRAIRKLRTELTDKQQFVYECMKQNKLSYVQTAQLMDKQLPLPPGRPRRWQSVQELYRRACEVKQRKGRSVQSRRRYRDG